MWGIEVLAAVGPNADAFGPPAATGFDFVNQILTSIPHIFSVTASKRVFEGSETACTAFLEAIPAAFSAGGIRAGGVRGMGMGGGDIWVY